MSGKPVFAASEREKVLFPDPARPVTRTRRPIGMGASLIDPVSLKCRPGAGHIARSITRGCRLGEANRAARRAGVTHWRRGTPTYPRHRELPDDVHRPGFR